ncbi:Hypothetical_protein [Hexamita inflata]|uniref:Hypothetical_protein n=1 Tax=Hexamita inflata TaxID=28002 RepID=A0AA86NH57_9EUKA|nr:Hypothetical protein HINF_LOCUS6683 [Hexamita inflata]
MIKKYVFPVKDGMPIPITDFVNYCYGYFITRYIPNTETMEERVRRILAECCWEDAFSSAVFIVKEEQNFKYNTKLMVGIKEMLRQHYSSKQQITAQFETQDTVVIHNFIVSKSQWNNFCSLMDDSHYKLIIKKIDDLLPSML